MIQLNNIEKVYRTDTVETQALNNISLHVKKGEFLSIMGPSTLFNSSRIFITSSPIALSKFPVGSSARIIEGLLIKALATATRWR